MNTPTPGPHSALAALVTNLALELNFAEPGKDIGLLPINNFLMQMAELRGLPTELAPAIKAARGWIDRVFDTTGLFDDATLSHLANWSGWMESAIAASAAGTPLPPAPDLPELQHPAKATPATPTPTPAAAPQPTTPPAPGAAAGFSLNLEADGELLREFASEGAEHLQNIEQGILVLEDNPTDADTLNSVFRAFHSFKGCAGFLNLITIKGVAQELESLLDAARQGRLTLTSELINLILEGGDLLRQFVNEMNAQLNGDNAGRSIVIETGDLIERVRASIEEHTGAAAAAPAPAPATEAAPAPAPAPVTAIATTSAPPVSTTAPAKPTAASTAGPKPTSADKPKTGPGAHGGAVKGDTLKLDSLIDLVGELVIAQSMVVQDPEVIGARGQQLMRNLAQLRRIATELQRTAMSLRMVPIRATFQKMNRLVRDLASSQGKQLQLVLSGEDTELDRNIVEELNDPLVHMIRNSCDHGVEMPDTRVAAGKNPVGTINLRAFHQGGNIVIQIQDDGRGLNPERILAKAREKGLVKPDEVLSEKDIFDLIFAPGFSTAEKVTDLSGRGVGMDVVRRNIEQLRGKVEINSIPGHGATFTIYLPLTLAIIDGMIVGVGSDRYIIPTLSVRESFRPQTKMISTVYQRGEVISVRGKLTPLLRLSEHFETECECRRPEEGIVIVVESGQQTRCILVDELVGKQEVVIKSLGEAFKTQRALAGAAILGDGRVGPILDVDALVRLQPDRLALAA